ncbi:methyl-accepting chemotaxis protein [Roseofilum casamattae]|uniref:Methyl-accepting chemotaxis protein n=1 Tax=Roseofilum casamattae BLCC-M143 TaxID=3022442 RepID=A0ABT7BRH5_9CYAN|nr:methyl-accepting chemotaxis protein [Roseofilum casamattae]MDJ1181794.1 methyl-accepting chemotaxis protein [Roseofilum casamattae BLCC-M143]
MFAHLKIKGRLLLGYAIPISFTLLTSGLVYLTAQEVFQTFRTVDRVQHAIVEMSDLNVIGQGMIRSNRGYLAVGNPIFLQEFKNFSLQFDLAANNAKKRIKLLDQLERLEEIIVLKKQYQEFSDRVNQLLQEGKREEAIALFNTGEGTGFVQNFDRLQSEFYTIEEALLQQETNNAVSSLNRLILVISVGTIALIVVAVVLALWISGGLATAINRATEEVALSSAEIASTIGQQEQTAVQQASSVNQTTTTMDELGASSRQVSEQAEASVSAAQQALQLAQGGSEAVENTLQGMEDLREKVSTIAQQIVLLSEQTGQIGNISALVSDLASQTNMLALNAAVEAVRAGEHGKGFAVVASEIRKLADQSRKSADKINSLAIDIQGSINSTVMVTEEGTKTVTSGVDIAQATARAFAGVTDAINDVVLNNQQISLNIKQQAIAIQQVVEAMNSINQGARETANTISQTRMGTEKLNEAAINLKRII